MAQFFNKISFFFNIIKSNIAFYPSIIAVLGFIFSLLMLFLEDRGISKYLMDALPQLMVENGDTALTILSVCIGGLISMMVFSFSMVMLLLSQASSNFSPRLLPGLISDKRHQIILGVYLATIMYNIFTLFSIAPSEEKYTLPGLSVLIGVLLTIACLCAFIYFIHNMSENIQISNILNDIHKKAKVRLTHVLELEQEMSATTNFENTQNWHAYKAHQSGYFQNFASKNMVSFCKKHDTKIHIKIPKGLFVLDNNIFFKSEKELTDDQLKAFYSNINFSRSELVGDNYNLAFKQITEIAIKAMSPGINDPGTALNAIDYLTELLAIRMQKKDVEIFVDEDNNPFFKVEISTLNEILYNVMASLRTYCKHDPILVQKLMWMLNYLKKQPYVDDSYPVAIKQEIKRLKKDARSILAELKNEHGS